MTSKVKYVKEEDMGLADELSRKEGEKTTVSPNRSTKKKWEKHILERNGKNIWRFDNGTEKIIPKKEIREEIIMKQHKEILHRGIEYVYYELKKTFYWPGIKLDIEKTLKKCEICLKVNRKKTTGATL